MKTIPYGVMTSISRFLVLLFLALSATAHATDFAGPNVIVPIAGRTPGAFGSEWRTDLIVTNASRTKSASVYIVLFAPDRTQMTFVELAPLGTAIYKDVLLATFGRATGSGMIRVASQSPEALITARARIYNVGGAQGEYGQIVQGVPATKLAKEAYLSALSGVNGNRTNVGIANPGDTDAEVFISLFARDGEARGGFATVIPAFSVRQMNDIFSQFQTGPLDGATIQITSSHGVYPYASIVRNDTGDADFVAGAAARIDEIAPIVTPACAAPAPIALAVVPAPGWIVVYDEGVDSPSTTAALAAKYGFTPKNVYAIGFHAELTQATIAALRCETPVSVVEQNAYGFVD